MRRSLADSPSGGARRRSLSATRALTESTVQFVGRIGASLRIASSSSARQRKSQKAADISSVDSVPSEANDCAKQQSPAEHWFRTVRLRRRSERMSEQIAPSRGAGEQLVDADSEMFALIPPDAVSAPSRSCPSTPRPVRRRYLQEGACQLTSICTLSHHHRYLFLFNDLLLVCKQKGENSYKLKERVALEFLWLSANNCTNSFLVGWPPARNYIAHFSSEREKVDWFQRLSAAVQHCVRPSRATTVGLFVQIEGRHQFIRKEVRNGRKADELLEELCGELHLPPLDPHLGQYELCFCPGGSHKIGRRPSALPASLVPHSVPVSSSPSASDPFSGGRPSPAPSPALLRRVHSHTSLVPQHQQIRPLHGVENVYAVLMDFVRNQLGISLSDSQLAHLDTCPLVNCRLVLRQTGPHSGQHHSAGGHPSHKGVASAAALNLVNQFRRVLGRAESTNGGSSSASVSSAASSPPLLKTGKKRHLFGKPLRGTMPPQPVLTMIDHLLLYGADAEGIFRKSPKQQTVRTLRQQLDQGQVPDFHQYNVHVTASLLKDYLRSIPGQLLISGNYRLWMEATNTDNGTMAAEERVRACRKLLALLPPAHTVLLRSLLRLLRKVAANEVQTKMGVSALAVCVAPSLLEKLEAVESVRLVPELVMFLVEHAPALFDGFMEDGPLLPPPQTLASGAAAGAEHHSPLHQSTDSGLSEVGQAAAAMGIKRRPTNDRSGSVSPDSGKLSSEPAESEDDESHQMSAHQRSTLGRKARWMMALVQTQSLDECELERREAEAEEESEKTPIALSRENSDVKDTAKPPPKFFWHSQQLAADEKRTTSTAARNSVHSGTSAKVFMFGAESAHKNFSAVVSPAGTVTPRRKESTASVDSNASSGGAAMSRRALLAATKSDALGLSPQSSRKSSLASNGRGSAQANGKQFGPKLVAKTHLQRSQPLSGAAIANGGTTANSYVGGPVRRASLWTPQPEKRQQPNSAQQVNRSLGSSAYSSACPSPALSDRNSPSSAFYSSSPAVEGLRRFSSGTSALRHNGSVGGNQQQRRASDESGNKERDEQPVNGGGSQRYILPKRTAEELLLDRLEVNWSVPQIRKTFQRNGELKPIDTVYAKLPAAVGAGGPK